MREQGIFFCTEDVKLLSKKGNYAMLKTEDYRLAVQSLSAKGVMLRNCKQQCKALVCMQTSANCVTYSDFIQIGILVVALISLYQNRG